MYINLHTLPPGQALYTLHVAPAGTPLEQIEEYDAVAPAQAPGSTYLTSVVVQAAYADLVKSYGDTVQVYGIVSQTDAHTVFDSHTRGYRPMPVVVPARMADLERPYDTFLDLCSDEHDGLGTAEYRDWLLEG